jgi:hypothetical protein
MVPSLDAASVNELGFLATTQGPVHHQAFCDRAVAEGFVHFAGKQLKVESLSITRAINLAELSNVKSHLIKGMKKVYQFPTCWSCCAKSIQFYKIRPLYWVSSAPGQYSSHDWVFNEVIPSSRGKSGIEPEQSTPCQPQRRPAQTAAGQIPYTRRSVHPSLNKGLDAGYSTIFPVPF